MIFISTTESVDTSANLLAEALDAEMTKDANKKYAQDAQVIFYGVVKTPDGFKFDKDRMFHIPSNTAKLLKRKDVFSVLEKNKIKTIPYKRITGDTNYTNLKSVFGNTFDVAIKQGMQVIETIHNANEFNKIKGKVDYACAHLTNKTKKYRVYLGVPDICSVIGASYSEYRKLSFKEALKFGSDEDTAHFMDNLFLKGILKEEMSSQTDDVWSWTEEKFSDETEMVKDDYYKQLENLAEVIHKNYEVDFCAVDVIINDGKLVVVNVTGSPSLQADKVLGFTSTYFKKLVTEGRNFTVEALARLGKAMSPTELNNLGKVLQKLLAQK